jgi:RNA polymerase sigma factor (sigma-70 family)
MAGGSSTAVLRDIQTLFDAGTVSGLTDRQLLERLANRCEASTEAAFDALVRRHGPMVLRVCRNVLGDTTDADDAFQATFLVLVRRYRSIRKLESLGSWLYGVAARVAARAQVDAARRRAAERRGPLRVVQAVEPSDGVARDRAEFGSVIQDEVLRLPEKHRAVVTLCYWQGLTQEQAAAQLGCPLGTVRSRLARARDRLHRRLTRRGVAPLAGAFAASLESQTSEAAGLGLSVPITLTNSTVKAGVQVFAGRAMDDVVSTSVGVLAQRVLRSLFMMKLKTIAGLVVLASLGAVGASLAARQADSDQSAPRPRRSATSVAQKSKSKAQPPLVTLGDYVVEPPDLLLVEVLEALPGRPISGERLVRPDGKISLGFYGDVYVAGLTLPEVKEKVIRHLQQYLEDHALGITEIDEHGRQGIDPATNKPRSIDPKDSTTVFVDVTAYNSKPYYVQGEVVVPGRIPVTGTDTVLDGINYAGGLTSRADHSNVTLYRLDAEGRLPTAMHIDIDQISLGDDLSTNYQLKPGDRLVVRRKPGLPTDERGNMADGGKDESAPKSKTSLHFDRAIDRAGQPRADRQLPGDPSDRAMLMRLDRRMTHIEQKLGEILEALKKHTP